MSFLELRDIHKTFKGGDYLVKALGGLSLSLDKGESVAITGPSGSGKSTLLNIAGLLLQADAGSVWLNGESAGNRSDAERCALRNAHIGYVVQDYALLEDESVYNNIRLPLLFHRTIPRKEHKGRIRQAAENLGIEDKLHRPVRRLSGGERQRVGIARALVCDQSIVLADEPTGALDGENKKKVVDLLLRQVQERGIGLLIVTHDLTIAERCDRIIKIEGGVIA